MSVEIARIEGTIRCKVWRSGDGGWIGSCDAPQMTFQANTWAEMMDAIQEGVEMALQDFIATGDFEAFLEEQGWSVERPFDSDTEFDLPFVPELVEV